jgi:ketosteroid isomerase-like protein
VEVVLAVGGNADKSELRASESRRKHEGGASSPQIELIQAGFEAFGRLDVDAWLEFADPEVEFFPFGTATLANEHRPYRGHQGIRTYFADMAKVWEELDVTPHAFSEIRNQVLVRGRIYGRAYGGVLVDAPGYWVIKFREGRVISAAAFSAEDKAVQAFAESAKAAT